MYLQNKYTRWYYIIIQRAQSRSLSSDVYVEKHHIIPRSLGGDDDRSNLVILTAKEHFICHLLLTKMTTGLAKRSMAFAAWTMTHIDGRNRYTPKARTYEYLRTNLSTSYTGIKKTYCWWKGKKHTIKTLAKQREAKLGEKNPNYGKTPSAEWIKQVSEKQKGIPKPRYTCLHCGTSVGGRSNFLRWHNDNCKAITRIA